MNLHIDKGMIDKLLGIAAEQGITTRKELLQSKNVKSAVGRRGREALYRLMKSFGNPKTYHYARIYAGMINIILYLLS